MRLSEGTCKPEEIRLGELFSHRQRKHFCQLKHLTLSAGEQRSKSFVFASTKDSPSLLFVSSFFSFCCAVTFSTVRPLPEFSLSDSLLMTEPSSLGNLLWVTIATVKGGKLSGSKAHSQVMSSLPSTRSPFILKCPVTIIYFYSVCPHREIRSVIKFFSTCYLC